MSEHSADLIENASNVDQLLRDAGAANSAKLAAPEQFQNADGTWPVTECVACGVDIPEGRIALGRIRCIHCQAARERRRAGYFTVE